MMKLISNMLLYFASLTGIPAVLLGFEFQSIGVLKPDPSRQLVYPINIHGTTVYVTPLLGNVQLYCMIAAAVAAAIGVTTKLFQAGFPERE